jgi:hypothetical protein
MMRAVREQSGDNAMSEELKYQLRLTLGDPFANAARHRPDDPSIAPLTQVLRRHDAALKCQHDAFADYLREAEANGVEKYPLYAWTKQTVDDPVKESKYTKSFTYCYRSIKSPAGRDQTLGITRRRGDG